MFGEDAIFFSLCLLQLTQIPQTFFFSSFVSFSEDFFPFRHPFFLRCCGSVVVSQHGRACRSRGHYEAAPLARIGVKNAKRVRLSPKAIRQHRCRLSSSAYAKKVGILEIRNEDAVRRVCHSAAAARDASNHVEMRIPSDHLALRAEHRVLDVLQRLWGRRRLHGRFRKSCLFSRVQSGINISHCFVEQKNH